MTIGERIKEQRKIKKLTQEELAKKAEMARGTIQQYESGRREPTISQAHKLAVALNVPVATFVDVNESAVQDAITTAIAQEAGYLPPELAEGLQTFVTAILGMNPSVTDGMEKTFTESNIENAIEYMIAINKAQSAKIKPQELISAVELLKSVKDNAGTNT